MSPELGESTIPAGGCTTEAYDDYAAINDVEPWHCCRFCWFRILVATQVHFATDAGILMRFALTWGPLADTLTHWAPSERHGRMPQSPAHVAAILVHLVHLVPKAFWMARAQKPSVHPMVA